MFDHIRKDIQKEIEEIKNSGLYKEERILTSPQNATILTSQMPEVLNFCANNYLGLSNHPELKQAAQDTIAQYGFGLSSVRFICGTQNIHKALEDRISEFLGMEDTILYSSAFDANGGLFEPLLHAEDAIVSDRLNHASIIDGVRLCKAKRYVYKNNDMEDLEAQLISAREAGARRILIATDGVFSMDGIIAKVDQICDLADRHEAMVMIDDSHATGFVGKSGRGTHEYNNAMGRVDIITSTFGKALGGASGGFTSARKEIVDMLRQRSRPYLFSNSVAPAIVGATMKALDLLMESTQLRDQLETNTAYFRKHMGEAGFDIVPGVHPIVPIMLYDAKLAQTFSQKLLEEGIYVIGFFYPVVPKGLARIRVQISAAHTEAHLNKSITAFIKVGQQLGIID